MDLEQLTVPVIGHVLSPRTEVSDDYWGGVNAIIRLAPTLPPETLQGLDEFSHLQVVFRFHLAAPEDVHLGVRSPRGNAAWPPSGTFAHRNHRRPAQIAISHPRLLRIEGRDLYVTDLDAVDGTPVIDFAPVFSEMGPRGVVAQPAWPSEMLAGYWADVHQRSR